MPLSITRAGQRARLTFSGTAGQRLSLGLTGSTISSGSASILNPDGTTLAGPNGFGSSGSAVDTPALPSTGTYAALVDPSGVSTGNVTLTLSEEVTGTITPGGAAVPVSITRAGQRARITFGGTTGQRVSLNMTGITIPQGYVTLLNPDGSANGVSQLVGPSSAFMEPRTLGATGTQAILIDPTSAYTGRSR